MAYSFDRIYIDGQWVCSGSGETIRLQNPATLEYFASTPSCNTDDVDKAVAAARKAQPAWAATPLEKRCELMSRMLEIFREHRDLIIELEAKELGAPVSFSKFSHCEYQFVRIESYIKAVKSIEFERLFAASTVLREPIGVVAAITPWNYPLGQVVQKIIPAVLMGNTVVLKPSQHTPLTAYLLIDSFDRAGFPAGVVNMITGTGRKLGDHISKHPGVDMISFTGSTAVGITLSQNALQSMKRISLELGGKSPFIWMPMPDYEPAIPKLFSSIFLNSGQTCTSLSRLLVPRKDLAKVEELIARRLPELTVGDPTDPATRIGPVASKAQFEKINEYIRIGIAEGARLVAGGPCEDSSKGYFIRPTVFSDVTNDMRIAREEIFGPVLSIIPYDSLDEAVAMANDTPYGLNAAVYGIKAEAIEIAKRLKSGNVYINDAPRDVTAPFGGYKQSGIGREGGIEGLMEFSQLKAVFDHGKLP